MQLLQRIPESMRSYPQWLAWKYSTRTGTSKLAKLPFNPITHKAASVTDPATWTTFDKAIEFVHLFDGIGFVLTENDPYSFVDLDVAPGEQPSADQERILKEFDSYSEISPSGNGMHIIVKGKVPTGRRKNNVEVYSSARYMTMTGNVWHDTEIKERSILLQTLWAQMGSNSSDSATPINFQPQTEADEQIIAKAVSASNGEKFIKLFVNGDIQDYQGDQSRADQSLINILAFYTKNKEQIARLFHSSPLGKRDKAQRVDYLESTIKRALDNELPSIDLSGLRNQFTANLMESKTDTLGELLELASTAPDTQFIVESWLPSGEVAMLSANGGVGKTMMVLQMGLAVTAGTQFFNLATLQGPFLFVSAEDTRTVIAKRLGAICKESHLLSKSTFTKCIHNNFHLWEIIGKPLWVDQRNFATGMPTAVMNELEQRISSTGAKLVAIDNASSVFAANHMDNVQVTAFISHLRNLAKRTDCTILLLAHVSADSATKGASKSYFGSTAWSNAVRSRMFMNLIPESNGIAEYIAVSQEKSNYGRLAEPFKLYRDNETGILHPLHNKDIAQAIEVNISALAHQVLGDITAIFNKGERVSTSMQGPSTTYINLGQHFPSKYPDGNRQLKQKVKSAIHKLSEDKAIFRRMELTASRNYKEAWVPASPALMPTGGYS